VVTLLTPKTLETILKFYPQQNTEQNKEEKESTKEKEESSAQEPVERTSMIAHIYPSVLQAASGRGYAGCLDGRFQGYRGKAIHDLGYELPRISLLRTRVNREG
jgi:hypothetical protein